MSLFDFFQKKQLTLPWDNQPSLYSFIESHIGANGELLTDFFELPDTTRRFKPTDIRWVQGGQDNVFAYHTNQSDTTSIAKQIAELFNAIAIKSDLQKKIELYNILLNDNVITFIDPTFEKISELKVPINDNLYKFIHLLAFESPDRGPVKFGIAALGFIGKDNDIEKLKILGLHEEFTLYVAVAINRRLDNSLLALWDLAKHVHGWGRVNTVERIANTPNLPDEIKDWLLREGYKNNVMYEYLAYPCAVSGNLLGALTQEKIDDELLDSAGELIQTLILGINGPAAGMDQYADCVKVIDQYITHVTKSIHTLKLFSVLHTIKKYIGNENAQHPDLNPTIRKKIITKLENMLRDEKWKDLILNKLTTSDDQEYFLVNQAAEIVGIDMWSTHWQRIQEKPFDSTLWYFVMQCANNERITQIIDFAEKTFPANKIATGPTHNTLLLAPLNGFDSVISNLYNYPGKGENLVKNALKSSSIRVRNMALKTLSVWGDSYIELMKKELENALEIEPNEEVKKTIQKVLKKEQLNY